ncbi:adhesion G protein-coupled receptor E2-like [Ostrea edulis]|uniref:adhesion G protein-coupled receptor E2-like n=1 Tax=Ostrea edulis TaxID=37623 RepID=UPI0024AF1682|nr:adhesion G protein-coupled receptor E2-like [Ostrea edulis]
MNTVRLINVLTFCSVQCVLCKLNTEYFPASFQTPEQGYCLESYRCQGRSDPYTQDNCQCDSDCLIYGDCCPDYKSNHTVENKAIPRFTCEYRDDVDSDNFIYIVNSCPSGTDPYLKKKCETENDVFDHLSSGLSSGYLYKNMYCALCNFDNYVTWNPGIQCHWRYSLPENLSVSSLQNDTDCYVTHSPPEGNRKQRTCFPISSNVTECQNKTLMTLCKFGYYVPVFGMKTVFRNVHCAKCQNYPESNLTCNMKSANLIPYKPKRNIYNYSYRILFDLNLKKEMTETRFRLSVVGESTNSLSNVCDIDHLLDPLTGQCYKILCKPPFVYQNGKCLLKERLTNDPNNTSSACLSRIVRQNEFELINSTTIFLFSLNRTMHDFTLSENESDAYVCINGTKIDDQITSTRLTIYFTKEERLLSFVGGILSTACLLVCFTVYVCSPKLHNVPGKNLMCLMASLFVAQLLHLIAPFIFEMKNQGLCKAISIVTHFAFLAAFFWMNVMSFDIFFTFSTGFTNSGERGGSSKRVRFYWLYAWLGAVIIVGSAASVEYTSDSSFKPGYGDGVCWISNSRGLIVFFLVPIAILLFSNFVFFIISAISIHTSFKKTSRILKRKNTCKLFIYIKLSVVMGLTWCFGFSAAATNSQALWYLFIVFNTLQGFFIATFFVCTKKVFQIVRDGASSFYSSTRSFTVRKSLTSKLESEGGRDASRKFEARC